LGIPSPGHISVLPIAAWFEQPCPAVGSLAPPRGACNGQLPAIQLYKSVPA
jgi:hypothetical protein